jgi:hypothetical protein
MHLGVHRGRRRRRRALRGLFRWVFIVAAAFLSVAFVALLALKERPLRGPTLRPVGSPPVAAE